MPGMPRQNTQLFKLTSGEPDTLRGVRPVRREAFGNLPQQYGKALGAYPTLLFRVAYPICNNDKPGMGADRQQLLKSPVRYRLSRLPHHGVRRHLCGAGEQYHRGRQPTQRDIFSCGLYGDPLLFPVQIRRTCEVDIFSALVACQG